MMMDGFDYVSDREWERAIYGRAKEPRDILINRYPRFRADPIVEVRRGSRFK